MTKLSSYYQMLIDKKATLLNAENDARECLVKFLELYPDQHSIYVGHQGCGIEHYITDFKSRDEMGVAEEKVMESIRYDEESKKLIATCDDGSETDSFAIEDLAYLLDTIIEDDYVEILVNSSENN